MRWAFWDLWLRLSMCVVANPSSLPTSNPIQSCIYWSVALMKDNLVFSTYLSHRMLRITHPTVPADIDKPQIYNWHEVTKHMTTARVGECKDWQRINSLISLLQVVKLGGAYTDPTLSTRKIPAINQVISILARRNRFWTAKCQPCNHSPTQSVGDEHTDRAFTRDVKQTRYPMSADANEACNLTVGSWTK